MSATAVIDHRPGQLQSPPGDLAIWVFILAELLAFCAFFATYAFTRVKNVELFNTMQLTLDRDIGALNTILLITASWCVARAVAAIKQEPIPNRTLQAGSADTASPPASGATHASRNPGRRPVSADFLLAAIVCGAGFLALKMVEYSAKMALGINLTTNTFYMFYLSLTFFHFMHVILGMVILGAVWLKTLKGGYSPADHHGMETGASYWHMVDLVWIILFPLIYVMH